MDFIEVQGQQITPKPLINISKNCINFGGKFSRIRTVNYFTSIVGVQH
jgi:hypothetical protein